MNSRHSTVRGQAFACAALAIALVGCRGLSERPEPPAEGSILYYDLGDKWTTTKRRVRFYDCRTGSMVCTGPASYVDVNYQCRCE